MQNLLYRAEIFDVESKVEFFNSIAQNRTLVDFRYHQKQTLATNDLYI